MIPLLRVTRSRWLFLLACVLSAGLCPSTVYADGGAPQLAYVAGSAQGISVIDIAQRRLIATFPVAGNPHAVLLSQDGHALYVTQPAIDRVVVLAAQTGKALCSASLPGQPSLLALSLDTTVLYAAGQGDTSVRVLDPTTCAIQHIFETHEPVYGLAVTASTASNATPTTPNQIWVVGRTGLTIFDATGQLLGSVAIPGGPQYISIPGGLTAYVTTHQGTVVAVDLNTQQIMRTLLNGGQFGPMDYDATTGEVYVPDLRHNQMDVLTPVTASTAILPREPVRVLQLSGSPQAIAITNDGQFGFAALANGQVLMLDIPARRIVASLAVGGTPQFIITGLYPPTNTPVATPQQTQSSLLQPDGVLFLLALVLVAALVLAACWFLWRRSRKRGGHIS
ncbi:MAG TPA: YncE family protein [Ktedonobacteraceae bacterium]